MNKQYLNSIAPLTKDKFVWDAFLAVLAFEEGKAIAKLNGPQSPDTLIRINERFTFIQHLRNLRENANAASEFTNG